MRKGNSNDGQRIQRPGSAQISMQQLVKSAQGTASRTIPAGQVMEGAGRKHDQTWLDRSMSSITIAVAATATIPIRSRRSIEFHIKQALF